MDKGKKDKKGCCEGKTPEQQLGVDG
jgi:hypothetical protein